MLPEHSAILLTFIKLLVVIKTFVLFTFEIEWPFYTGFTVYKGSFSKSQQNDMYIIHPLDTKINLCINSNQIICSAFSGLLVVLMYQFNSYSLLCNSFNVNISRSCISSTCCILETSKQVC